MDIELLLLRGMAKFLVFVAFLQINDCSYTLIGLKICNKYRFVEFIPDM